MKLGEAGINSIKAKSLGVVLDDPYYRCDEVYYAANPLATFFEHLRPYFPNGVILCPPVGIINKSSHKDEICLYRCSGKISFVDRPYYSHKLNFISRIGELLLPTVKRLAQLVRSVDILMIRTPSVVSYLAFLIGRYYGKPILLYMAGDLVERGHQLQGKGLFTRNALRLFVMCYAFLERSMAKNSHCLIFGDRLLQRIGSSNKRIKFEMSLIPEEVVSNRKDTCNATVITLLYVGYLADTKGIPVLLSALNSLRDKGINAKVKLVGYGPLEESLRERVSNGELNGSVLLVAAKPFGQALFDEYKTGDLFVLPSLSEGIPKVLFEAMAFGLPIVATRVGGIPDIIKNEINGLLVDPLDSKGLANSIQRIIETSSLRRSIIKENYKIVQGYTLNRQIDKFVQFVATI